MASLKKKPLPRMQLDTVPSECHTICCEQQHALVVQSATSQAVIEQNSDLIMESTLSSIKLNFTGIRGMWH